ncbi:MAG: AI-2E family transporter [Patescibacteria group bacterium]
MNLQNIQNVYFLGILGVVLILSICIFWPFLTVIALAVMMALVLGPVYDRATKFARGSKNIGALLTILFLVVVIILPLTFVAAQIFQETQGIYTHLTSSNEVSIDQLSNSIQQRVSAIAPDFNLNIREYAAAASAWIVARLGSFFSSTLDFVLKLILALVALFYFLRDGDKFREHISALSPLPQGEDETIIKSLKTSVKSVVVGSLIIALVQGLLAGIGFAIFGVPNPSLWGTVAAIGSLIPGVGTAIVWIPATIYLFVTGGSSYMWLGQLLWSVLLVGTIDNFLSPFLLEKGINIHPILILFSILGGLQFFGPEGFLLGPLVLSLLFALVRVYQHSSGSDKKTSEVVDDKKIKEA